MPIFKLTRRTNHEKTTMSDFTTFALHFFFLRKYIMQNLSMNKSVRIFACRLRKYPSRKITILSLKAL